MNPADDGLAVARALEKHWTITGDLSELPEGSLSRAWLITSTREPLVAKLARDEQAHFDLGLRLSEHVNRTGISAGAPLRTTAGDLSVDVLGRRLAVLELVAGRPATIDDLDPYQLGQLLGRVHLSISEINAPGAWTLDDVCGHIRRGVLPVHPPWVSPFVHDAIAQAMQWPPARHQMLRGDGFELRVREGTISGLIDWGATRWGSVADDIGCWTVHLGPICGGYQTVTTDLIAGYRTVAPLTEQEADAVPIYQRLRLASRPAYVTDERHLAGLKEWIDGWLASQ